MAEYEDRYWTSRDGLRLHCRDYPGGGDRPPLICLPGLTRNARDFEELASRLAGQFRVLCVELRGRGESEYAKEASTYSPVQYVDDVTALLEDTGIDRFIAIGTSLGGLMTMLIAMTTPERLAGAIINDAGPVLEVEGLERIKSYVGQGRTFPTWVHAARAIEQSQGVAFPGYALPDWIEMAKRLMVVSGNGRIVFDYDMKIAEPFADFDPEAQADLWPGVAGLSGKPVLVVRGEISDILSEQTTKEMQARDPEIEVVTVADTGHAPTLSEPEAAEAIDRFLAKFG
ncbi:MAG: alpha/beta hydrolase [Novosphingobium sp.]|nr:alpha/beta hydrolase [Novosphingobium sp.]